MAFELFDNDSEHLHDDATPKAPEALFDEHTHQQQEKKAGFLNALATRFGESITNLIDRARHSVDNTLSQYAPGERPANTPETPAVVWNQAPLTEKRAIVGHLITAQYMDQLRKTGKTSLDVDELLDHADESDLARFYGDPELLIEQLSITSDQRAEWHKNREQYIDTLSDYNWNLFTPADRAPGHAWSNADKSRGVELARQGFSALSDADLHELYLLQAENKQTSKSIRDNPDQLSSLQRFFNTHPDARRIMKAAVGVGTVALFAAPGVLHAETDLHSGMVPIVTSGNDLLNDMGASADDIGSESGAELFGGPGIAKMKTAVAMASALSEAHLSGRGDDYSDAIARQIQSEVKRFNTLMADYSNASLGKIGIKKDLEASYTTITNLSNQLQQKSTVPGVGGTQVSGASNQQGASNTGYSGVDVGQNSSESADWDDMYYDPGSKSYTNSRGEYIPFHLESDGEYNQPVFDTDGRTVRGYTNDTGARYRYTGEERTVYENKLVHSSTEYGKPVITKSYKEGARTLSVEGMEFPGVDFSIITPPDFAPRETFYSFAGYMNEVVDTKAGKEVPDVITPFENLDKPLTTDQMYDRLDEMMAVAPEYLVASYAKSLAQANEGNPAYKGASYNELYLELSQMINDKTLSTKNLKLVPLSSFGAGKFSFLALDKQDTKDGKPIPYIAQRNAYKNEHALVLDVGGQEFIIVSLSCMNVTPGVHIGPVIKEYNQVDTVYIKESVTNTVTKELETLKERDLVIEGEPVYDEVVYRETRGWNPRFTLGFALDVNMVAVPLFRPWFREQCGCPVTNTWIDNSVTIIDNSVTIVNPPPPPPEDDGWNHGGGNTDGGPGTIDTGNHGGGGGDGGGGVDNPGGGNTGNDNPDGGGGVPLKQPDDTDAERSDNGSRQMQSLKPKQNTYTPDTYIGLIPDRTDSSERGNRSTEQSTKPSPRIRDLETAQKQTPVSEQGRPGSDRRTSAGGDQPEGNRDNRGGDNSRNNGTPDRPTDDRPSDRRQQPGQSDRNAGSSPGRSTIDTERPDASDRPSTNRNPGRQTTPDRRQTPPQQDSDRERVNNTKPERPSPESRPQNDRPARERPQPQKPPVVKESPTKQAPPITKAPRTSAPRAKTAPNTRSNSSQIERSRG